MASITLVAPYLKGGILEGQCSEQFGGGHRGDEDNTRETGRDCPGLGK